jgi:serine/threonine protein kinase
MVAVKRMSSVSEPGGKKHAIEVRDFNNEAISMKKARHKNIVRLLGYSSDKEPELLICSEYVPNGSLQKYIEGIGSAILFCFARWISHITTLLCFSYLPKILT